MKLDPIKNPHSKVG